MNLSRKLEKEVASLQKSKERVANELTESQEHVTYLESEYPVYPAEVATKAKELRFVVGRIFPVSLENVLMAPTVL